MGWPSIPMTRASTRMAAQSRAVKRVFPGERDEIRARSAQAALDLLRRLLGGA